MKWLLTMLVGALLGAGALFVYLRNVPQDPVPLAVVAAPPAATAPAPAAVPPPEPAPAPEQMAGMPPAPVVTPDLNEADLLDAELPIRPTPPLPAVISAASAGARPAGKLLIPVDGIASSQLADTFTQARGKARRHDALDIMAPKGTKVLAVADGKVVKLFNSKPGGLTVYQFDPSEKFAYYYAHLERYASGVKEGSVLKRGDLVGYVGSTGNADPKAPHLHFAVVELTPEKQWWKGTPLNPYPLLVD